MADNTIVKEQEEKKKQDKMLVILPDGSEALAPSHEALQGVAQNKWKLPETDVDGLEMTVPISDAQGTFEVSARDINNNITDFIDDPNTNVTTMDRVMADEAERRKQIVSEAFDMPLTAFGAGAFRGATFGLSDVLLEQTLGKEALANLKKENETASLVGDIAGTVLPAIATGGTSLAARGAQKTAAGLASKLANDVGEKAAAKLIKKYGIKNELAQSAIRTGATGAIEGALYSGGRSLVDEALLGDEKANYAKVLEDTLTGGLFEGALGAGLGPAANLIGKAGKAGVSKVTEYAKHPKLWDGVKKTYASAVGAIRGKEAKKALDDVFSADKYNQEVVARYLDDTANADKDLGDSITFMMNELGKVENASLALRKKALSNPELDEPFMSHPKLPGTYNDLSEEFTKTRTKLMEETALAEENTLPIIDNIERHLDPTRVDTIRDFANGLRNAKKEADYVLSLYRNKMGGNVTNITEDIKQFGTKTSGLPPTITLDEMKTFQTLLPLKNKIDELIKDYQIFGESAKELKLADQLYSAVVEPARKIKDLGAIDEYVEQGVQKDIPSITRKRDFDSIIVAQKMRKKTSRKQKLNLEAAVKAVEDSLNKIGAKLPELGLDTNFAKELDRFKDNLELSRGITALESSTGKNLRGMLFGSIIGGLPGTAIGLAVENPIMMTKLLMRMEKQGDSYQKAVDAIGDTFTKKLPKTTLPLNVIHPIMYDITGTKKDEDPKKVIEKFNTGEVYEHLDNRIQMIENAAPKHAAMMRQQTQMANNLVAQELPPVVKSGVLGRDTKLVMTPSQTQRVNQVMLASYAPKTFLEYIKNGNATKAGMNALKEVHPNLYFELQQEAAQTIVNKDVPYQNKMKLQYMFELPATFELSDISLKQSAYASQGNSQEKSQGGQPDPTGSLRAKGLDQMERSVDNAAPSAQFG